MGADRGHAQGSGPPPFRFADDWWQRGVVYQIYPRSFADSDGDGTGDLPGIIDHLDHLGPDGLGIDAIWLSPIYPSPGRDIGYDVSDHAAIDPRFGTEADFDRLVTEAHRRGIRIVLDLVMNHTSDEHPWFVASRASRQGPFADWYLWRDPSGVGPRGTAAAAQRLGLVVRRAGLDLRPGARPVLPPHLPGRTARARLARAGGRGRPVRHGPRLAGARRRRLPARYVQRLPQAPRHAVESASAADGPPGPARSTSTTSTSLTCPPCSTASGRWSTTGRRPMTVGELFVGTTENAAALTRPSSPRVRLGAAHPAVVRGGVPSRDPPPRAGLPAARWPTVVLSNHDQPRHASRLADTVGATGPARDAIAKAAAVLELTVRGTPFLYYGEELGHGRRRRPARGEHRRAGRTRRPRLPVVGSLADRGPRCRGPAGRVPGSRPARRGCASGPTSTWRNVAVQAADPDSVLACVSTPDRVPGRVAIAPGRCAASSSRTTDPDVLGFRRAGSGPEVLVLIGFADREHRVAVPRPKRGGGWRPVVGTHRDLAERLVHGSTCTLRPYEGLVAVRA